MYNLKRRTLVAGGFAWQCSKRKIAMDRHQSTRTILENNPFENTIKNFSDQFNLSSEAQFYSLHPIAVVSEMKERKNT